MKVTQENGKILALVHRADDWKKGLDFLTTDDSGLQAGTWWYDEGKTLDRHHHNILERHTNLTQECVIVLKGRMHVDVYTEDKKFLCDFELISGEFAIFLGGGHAYKILENDTKILETKNGPFMGVKLDKTRF